MTMERFTTFALLFAAGASLLATVAAAQNAVPAIGQKDRQFSQESVTIRPGGSVRFVNDDAIAHNVYARDPSGANRPGVLQRPGEESTLTFQAAGAHQVLCAIHPRMRMSVQVQP
jgi:plastocyanin